MAVEKLCRNGQHPIDYRDSYRGGRTYCRGCREDWEATYASAGLGRMGPWQTPPHDEARAQALAVWISGLAEAIEEVRRTEGFDGREQTWQTLGEFLPPDPTPRAPRLRPMNEIRTARVARVIGRI